MILLSYDSMEWGFEKSKFCTKEAWSYIDIIKMADSYTSVSCEINVNSFPYLFPIHKAVTGSSASQYFKQHFDGL